MFLLFQVKTYVHVFNQCNQNWFAVASIVEDVLKQIKTSDPAVNEAFIRSDNAGCYHCAPLILTIPGIFKRVGIKICRYDFSEPQSGKDICDRRTASMKSHMRRYLNEGNDIHTASDMKKALESYGGVKGCHVAVATVDATKQMINQHKWVGIQSFNNFEFLRTGIRLWKAFGVGKGKLISNAQLKKMASAQGETGLIILEKFGNPTLDKGTLKKQDEKEARSKLEGTDNQQKANRFHCPESSCVKVFVSTKALEEHLDTGEHFCKLEKESAYDAIKRKWASTCTTVSTSRTLPGTKSSVAKKNVASESSSSASNMGWAIRKSKSNSRFSKHQKDFLCQIFLQGEETGKKAHPSEVSSQMRSMRSADGKKKMFSQSEWLTVQQITSYFSRLNTLYKSGTIADHDEDDDEALDMYAEATNRKMLAEHIKHELEL
jgi:hypothetical protein